MSTNPPSKSNAGREAEKPVTGKVDPDESLSLTIAELFYPSFKRFFEGEDIVNEVEDDLGKANISKPVEIYMSTALGYGTLLGGLVSLILSFIAGVALYGMEPLIELPAASVPYSENIAVGLLVFLVNAIQFPILVVLIGGIGALLGFVGAFGFGVYYPKHVARTRAREIELLLGDAISFMYSLSVGGTNQIQVMQSVAAADDTYGEVSVEFQRVVYEMKYFNTDYQTAVENVTQLTPSKELEVFLSDMLSVIDSGGDMTTFLKTQQDVMRERSKKKQEEMLDTMEFFGEMYMSLNVLPMGLLIVLVIISMLGSPTMVGLYATVYALLPGLNLLFGIIISMVKKDEIGDGVLKTEGNVAAMGEDETRLNGMGVIDYYVSGDHASFFKPIRSKEFKYRLLKILREPWEYFRIRPTFVLALTIPMTVVVMATLVLAGLAKLSITDMVSDPYVQTVMWLYVPVFLNVAPLAVFHEWNRRTRGKITDTLTADIRKLANANETGQPVLEAMRMATTGQESLVSQEFQTMYKKAKFGTSLSPALVEFNNRYRIPRLARVVKLIQKAQEASSNITEVLQTAATTSRYREELEQDRIGRTRIQVAVTAMTFLVFLGVILMLEVYFIGQMISSVDVAEGNPIGGGNLDIALVSMLFFHAVTIQGLCAGALSGYIQTGKFSSSYKYIVAFMTITAIVWGIFAV